MSAGGGELRQKAARERGELEEKKKKKSESSVADLGKKSSDGAGG